MAVSANRLELLQIADAVAREKSIDRGIVIAAMEDAIAKAARSRYGSETEVRAEIDPKKGELRLSRHMLVVEAVENPANQIGLEDARRDALLDDEPLLLGIVRRGDRLDHLDHSLAKCPSGNKKERVPGGPLSIAVRTSRSL